MYSINAIHPIGCETFMSQAKLSEEEEIKCAISWQLLNVFEDFYDVGKNNAQIPVASISEYNVEEEEVVFAGFLSLGINYDDSTEKIEVYYIITETGIIRREVLAGLDKAIPVDYNFDISTYTEAILDSEPVDKVYEAYLKAMENFTIYFKAMDEV